MINTQIISGKRKIRAYNDSGHCTTYVGHNIQNIQPDPDSRVLFSRGQLLVQQASDMPADESIRIFIR